MLKDQTEKNNNNQLKIIKIECVQSQCGCTKSKKVNKSVE